MKKNELLGLAKPHYNNDQLLELEHAIDIATKAHHGQKRKSGEPYIIHPIAVAATLIDWGMDIDSVLAGVLHDTVEDTDITLEDIEKYFGKDVAFWWMVSQKYRKPGQECRILQNTSPKQKTIYRSY